MRQCFESVGAWAHYRGLYIAGGADAEGLMILLRKFNRAGLNQVTADVQGMFPADLRESRRQRLGPCRIGGVNTVHILDESTIRTELLCEEQRGEIRAATAEQHSFAMHIRRIEPGNDQHR